MIRSKKREQPGKRRVRGGSKLAKIRLTDCPVGKSVKPVRRFAQVLQICVFLGAFWGGSSLAAQTPAITSILNQALLLPPSGVAPGSVGTIFGTNLASSTGAASSLPLPTTLAGTSVTVAGFAAPLLDRKSLR